MTGGTSGLGFELSNILYAHNAKVYMAARSGDKAREVIENIKSKNPNSTGDVIYLHLDLDNLSTIKKSAEKFLSREKRLDVLWNNAGVMMSPKGSKTQQGYEKQLGTNALGPFLFTQQLMGVLSSTAKDSPEASVRVVWLSSSMVQLLAPPGGVDMGNLDYKTEKGAMHKYAVSKAANTFYSTELARRHSDDGIVSVVGLSHHNRACWGINERKLTNLSPSTQEICEPGFNERHRRGFAEFGTWPLILPSTVHIPSCSPGSRPPSQRTKMAAGVCSTLNIGPEAC